jgi:alkanesulfonate monooxygenase SsuD/methylene tetrahydromethanopterin reductase-like flavin-dependent oxidoreductase (luciferase family)
MGHAILRNGLSCSVVGGPQAVADGLRLFVERYKPDEIMATAQIFDHAARLRSFELLADIRASAP